MQNEGEEKGLAKRKKKEREWIHMTADQGKKGCPPLSVVPAHSVCPGLLHDLCVCALLLSLCAVCLQSAAISAHTLVFLLKTLLYFKMSGRLVNRNQYILCSSLFFLVITRSCIQSKAAPIYMQGKLSLFRDG